jgi:hypothetical protein
MAFLWGGFSATNLNDIANQLHAKLLQAGWTDVSPAGGPKRAKSAVDVRGRFAVVEITKETVGTVDYLLFRVSTTVDMSEYVIAKGSSSKSNDTFPKTIRFYCNEFWFYVRDDTADAGANYPVVAGLYAPPSDVLASQHPNPVFIAAPRDAGVSSFGYVYIGSGTGGRWFVWNQAGILTNGGCSVLGLAGPTHSFGPMGIYQFSQPSKRLAGQAVLFAADQWVGFLPYARFAPDPALSEADVIQIDGINYQILKWAYRQGLNFAVQV